MRPTIQIISALALMCSSALAASSTTTGANTCLNGEAYSNENGQFCCPGAVFGSGNNAFCCVGATYQVAQPTFASCFPTCSSTGTAANGAGVSSTTTQSCKTSVFLTDSNYSSKVAAATASGTGSSASGMSAGGSSSASSAGASSGSTTSSQGAAITSGPFAGALMIAGGLMLAV